MLLADFLKDWTTAITVVFIAVMALFNLLFLGSFKQSIFKFPNLPTERKAEDSFYSEMVAVQGSAPVDIESPEIPEENRFVVSDNAAVLNVGNPLSGALPTRDGLLIYKVQKGDTLSRIAANFGISLNTILWANENLRGQALKIGQEIRILPVTGVLYPVQDGDTLESIAAKYKLSTERILRVNPNLIPSKLAALASIIIPDSRPLQSDRSAELASLPGLPGFFAIPTTGWNWGQMHPYNAVDIANACGTPVYAAAEGLVIESAYGWNQGYGNYVMIEHPNSTKTRYAHNQKNLVSVGDYITKGDQISIMGNTGLTHGPTGCHLHFEVYGARNLFAK